MIPDEMKPALEGVIPANIVSCSKAGIPNITFITQVYYVSNTRVALSCQFLNKTLINIDENPYVSALVFNPETAEAYRLELKFVESKKEGPVFDAMKTRIDVIAIRIGMPKVFKLQSSEIFDVISVEKVNDVLEN